ncbi:MAG TPA: 7TM domain-containing protein [Candidatus Polarisedimenticolaceae bacterium]
MDLEGAKPAQEAALELGPAESGWRLVRRKGHLGTIPLAVLTALGCLPLGMVFCRILALPGGESLHGFGLGPFREFGELLEQWFTLAWIPASDRPSILYLLMLPTGALFIAIARLTLGIRVLGFRAILIAIGFRASGLVPSLVLMAVVVGTIVAIRPWFRRIRLPLYARVAVILCLSAAIMLGAVLIAPWLRSETVWSVAFFPVIIMAMLAEGVAKTLQQDNAVTAAWRAGWTIALALLIALVDRVIAPIAYQFPELILTELIAIVFVSEFLDIRLLEDWPARLTRLVEGAGFGASERPRVAVVRNQESSRFIGRLGPRTPAKYLSKSVQRPVDALRAQGFRVKVLEGDVTLLRELAAYLPPDPRRGSPGGIVLNLATGVQGRGRFAHVPAMLELAGVPYTGPDPLAQAQLTDRFVLMTLLGEAQVSVPRCRTVSDPKAFVDLDFPLAVRPRFEPDASRIVVRNRERLQAAIREIRRHHAQPAVVEEIVRGRRILASVLGNESLECLPLLEDSEDERTRICPAPLDETQAERVRECARLAFAAAGCRDYARIDIRLSPFGEPFVLDIRWVDLFDRRGAFVTAAAAAGYTFPALMRRIIDEAARRCLGAATVRTGSAPDASAAKVVSLAARRSAAE